MRPGTQSFGSLGDEDLGEAAGGRALELDGGFVGLELGDDLALLDFVPDGDESAGKGRPIAFVVLPGGETRHLDLKELLRRGFRLGHPGPRP